MPWCAICGDDSLPLTRQRLGPGEPEVLVCSDCDTLHPSSGRYAFDDSGAARRGLGGAPHGEGSRRKKPAL